MLTSFLAARLRPVLHLPSTDTTRRKHEPTLACFKARRQSCQLSKFSGYGQAQLYAVMAAFNASCVLLTLFMLQMPFLALSAHGFRAAKVPGTQEFLYMHMRYVLQ